eukprot:TRINITY_DN1579_c0_g1_i4.p1 TRINITY_DN1579_c0_g1~~TRINITY_DN1579_c0_g1_i4.p1  ORF type:complete len:174 (+),score=29.62 TRINITY_DN1579_c0_g1_i4:133-654(+)
MTADFAMQNVILQMGLRLMSVNGLTISTLRISMKRCYGCLRMEHDASREYCRHCGGHTLARVAVTVDEDGTVSYRQFNRQTFMKRGVKYSLPKPKGGRENNDIILREDQLMMGRYRQLSNQAKKKQVQSSATIFDDAATFGLQKVGQQEHSLQYGYGRKNPNTVRKQSKKKRK